MIRPGDICKLSTAEWLVGFSKQSLQPFSFVDRYSPMVGRSRTTLMSTGVTKDSCYAQAIGQDRIPGWGQSRSKCCDIKCEKLTNYY